MDMTDGATEVLMVEDGTPIGAKQEQV